MEGAAAVAVLDTDLRFLYVNPHLASVDVVPAEEHLGRTLTKVVPQTQRPEEVPALGHLAVRMITNGVQDLCQNRVLTAWTVSCVGGQSVRALSDAAEA